MKKNQSLFDKRIELKNCQINGGRQGDSARITTTSSGGGSDTTTTCYYEGGRVESCTHYNF